MDAAEINMLVKKQQEFFLSGKTLPVNFRISMLRKLRECIKKYQPQIHAALKEDLGKSEFEAFMCESGLVLNEISYMLSHVRKFSANKRVKTPLAQFAAKSYKKSSPRGNVLIMSPWNYPFLLTLDPLVDAIAAGNTAIVKPSAYSPATSSIIKKIIDECFTDEYVSVITGGREENACLLKEKFDFIFFTGSQQVGREVLRRAAENLTPAVLELGGKSPCIVEKSANLKLAAKRIVFGKFLNCGQTCVAPDYILCDRSVKDLLVLEICKQVRKQFGATPLANPDYGKIINRKHFERLCNLINYQKVICGGEVSADTLQISPTVMDGVSEADAVMQEEIFGPILPILTFESFDKVISDLSRKPKPLALYIFSEDKQNVRKAIELCSFGGGCVNDTVIHLATTEMGFGGVGESGMGAYHGKVGFDAFSHYKSIVDKKTWMDLAMRYQPYNKFYEKLLHMFLK